MLVFEENGKPEYPEKPLRTEKRTNNKKTNNKRQLLYMFCSKSADLLHHLGRDYMSQLFTEVEVNSGGHLPSHVAAR